MCVCSDDEGARDSGLGSRHAVAVREHRMETQGVVWYGVWGPDRGPEHLCPGVVEDRN